MAEIIGLVVSIATIGHWVHEAVQMAIKRKQLWEEVTGQIEDYWHDIQLLKDGLKLLEGQNDDSNSIHRPQNNPWFCNCLSRCRSTLELASKLVDDFLKEVTVPSKQRPALFGAKHPFNDKSLRHIEKQLQRLYQSGQSLQFYISCHSMAYQTPRLKSTAGLQQRAEHDQVARPALINETTDCTQEIANCMHPLQARPLNNNSEDTSGIQGSSHCGLPGSRRSWDEGWVLMSVRCPKWLSTRGWSIKFRNDPNGLRQFNFRRYNIRPSDSEIFLTVGKGDLDGMLRLFQSRNATPFDRDEQGLSLLHYASSSSEPLICRALLNLGLRNCIDEVTVNMFTPRQLSLWSSLIYGTSSDRQPDNVTLLFESCSGDSVHYASDSFFWLGLCRAPADVTIISRFQRKAAPLFFDQPRHMLLQAGRLYVLESQVGQHPNPDVLMFLLSQKQLHQFGEIADSTESRKCLLHTVAIGFARYHRDHRDHRLAVPEFHEESKDSDRLEKWKQMSRILMGNSTTDELHCVEHIQLERPTRADSRILHPEWTGTPLMSVLRATFLEHFPARLTNVERYGSRFWQKAVSSVTKQWLQQVADSGVDLIQYGQREQQVMSRVRGTDPKCGNFAMVTSCWSVKRQMHIQETLPVCLVSFDYGATAGDWGFHWNVGLEKLGGEF